MPLKTLNIVRSGIQDAFSNGGVWTASAGVLDGQNIRCALLGDSLSNINTYATGPTVQDSTGYALWRNWTDLPIAGCLSSTNFNAQFQVNAPSTAVDTATNDAHGYQNYQDTSADPNNSHGLSNYGIKVTREFEWIADAAAGNMIHRIKLNVGSGGWHEADWWTSAATLETGIIAHAFAGATGQFGILAAGTTTSSTTAITDLNTGTTGPRRIAAPDVATGATTSPRVEFVTNGTFNETGSDIIVYGAHFRVAGKSGWELYPCGIGGARYIDWIQEWDGTRGMISEANFVSMFGTGGQALSPNLFMVFLGANDGTSLTKAHIESLVQRCHDANNDARILLVAPYGTPSGLTQQQALDQAELMLNVARAGVAPNIAPERIAVLNTPEILGAPADASDLVDTIHWKQSYADTVTQAWQQAIRDAVEPSRPTWHSYRALRRRLRR